jgi:hypothetical protein
VTDQRHTQIRGFRNVLLRAFVLIALLLIGLVAVVSEFPSAMPMCFNPDVTGAPLPDATGGPAVCPSGEGTGPQRQVLAYALVLGYAQQLATRFIDDRAQSLLDALPGEDSDRPAAAAAAKAQ